MTVPNCTISYRLKEDKRFRKTSICFDIDHSWGSYEIVSDTIKLSYDDESIAEEYAVLEIDRDKGTVRLGQFIMYPSNFDRDIPYRIVELNETIFQ